MHDDSRQRASKRSSRVSKTSGKSTLQSKSPESPVSKGTTARATGEDATRLIDEHIQSLNDWRGTILTQVRQIILKAAPGIEEEWKWMGTPVWSCSGNICTGETYKQVVKLTFAHGASLPDPRGLFNSSLEGNTRRAIDIREGEVIDKTGLTALIRDAVKRNQETQSLKSKPSKKVVAAPTAQGVSTPSASTKKTVKKVVLLTGGNPQIAKAEGDAPVQAYITAIPGWKQEIGKRIDTLIETSVPNVQKAIKWNSPFYGMEGQGWFLSFHVFTHYVKVTFFKGIDLRPVPPGATERSKDARWLDIREHDEIDEPLLVNWIQQASSAPGWVP